MCTLFLAWTWINQIAIAVALCHRQTIQANCNGLHAVFSNMFFWFVCRKFDLKFLTREICFLGICRISTRTANAISWNQSRLDKASAHTLSHFGKRNSVVACHFIMNIHHHVTEQCVCEIITDGMQNSSLFHIDYDRLRLWSCSQMVDRPDRPFKLVYYKKFKWIAIQIKYRLQRNMHI